MPIEEFIIEVYCLVELYLKKAFGNTKIRRSGPAPALSDEEVITMEIVGEFIGHHEDKAIWSYFKSHWSEWFPMLGSRKTFLTQAANQFCGEATYGYCATKAERYYGFKGHLIISSSGVTSRFTVAPAHEDERNILPEIAEGFYGLLIADKGLIRPQLSRELLSKGIDLQTPLRRNMKDKRPKWVVKKIVSMRRLVETVIGQLVERFRIENIRAKNLWHFLRRVTRKILAHTIAFTINKNLNVDTPFQFQHLINN